MRPTPLVGRRSALSILVAGMVLACLSALASADARGTAATTSSKPAPCREARPSARYVKRVDRVLGERRDAWGRRLLRSQSGPTYEGVSRLLPPLFLARAANGRPLTVSGVHYTHFSQPIGEKGATSVALHVADGSEIISRRAHGRGLMVSVGRFGRERYGSCLRRLRLPELAEGYLPILETGYVDAQGVRYQQESFAAHVSETRSLVSFVKVTADATGLPAGLARVRFTPSVKGLASRDARLTRRRRTYLLFGEGGRPVHGSVTYAVPAGTAQTVYAAWLNAPAHADPIVLDEARYEEARDAVRSYWERRLARGGLVIVPEKRILDAERNLLVQNLAMTWRYSLGNRYEQLSNPEAMDVARVLAEFGQHAVSRTVLGRALRKKGAGSVGPSRRRTNWKLGSRLVAIASYVRLSGDVREVRRATPTARRYVRYLRGELRSGRHGLLPRERFSSDVAARVYGLHTQAVVWQGLRDMSAVWRSAGYTALANESGRLARQLERGLRQAVRRSSRRLPGGALFVPMRLLEREAPYRSVTASREGSYWNLVMPYALASGLFEPGGRQARGVLRYVDTHGGRIIGLLRTGAYGLYGRDAGKRRKPGANPVYGLNFSRFLADNDRADDLVLALYAQLAVAHTPGTFVSGETVSIAPFGGRLYRATYLPPNGASNAAFLETLRSLVVHENTDRRGVPRGLELAFATPRAWLQPGKQIEVRKLATSFGRLSYTLAADDGSVQASIAVPDRVPLRGLWLRFRLPRGTHVTAVSVNGAPYPGHLVGDTVGLPTTPGSLEVTAYTN